MINYHLYSVVKLSFKTNTCFSDDQFYYTNITKLPLPIIKKKITKFVFCSGKYIIILKYMI